MVKNVVNSIVVEPKQKRGRKPKNAALLTTENKILEENPAILEKDNNIIFSIQETNNNINALIKWIYGSVFNWIVSKVNSAHQDISTSEHKSIVKFIGILDIFGFEILRSNTFEQLCINYTVCN